MKNESVYHAPDIQRVLDRVIIREGCFAYDGFHHPAGYATCKIDQKCHRVHRILYTEFVGEVPEGMLLHHTCENKWCVNLDHLTPVTRLEHAALHRSQT